MLLERRLHYNVKLNCAASKGASLMKAMIFFYLAFIALAFGTQVMAYMTQEMRRKKH